MGLQTDLDMSGNDFSWLATAFFIAYAVAEIPQGMYALSVDVSPRVIIREAMLTDYGIGILLQRFPVTKVLGVNVFFWGVILCCSAASNTFASMIALRILLGIMEAVIGM